MNFWGVHVLVTDNGCKTTAPIVFKMQMSIVIIWMAMFALGVLDIIALFWIACECDCRRRETSVCVKPCATAIRVCVA